MIIKNEELYKIDELWRIEKLKEIVNRIENHECEYLLVNIDKLLLEYYSNECSENDVRGVLKYYYDKWTDCNTVLRNVKEKNKKVEK